MFFYPLLYLYTFKVPESPPTVLFYKKRPTKKIRKYRDDTNDI